MLERGTGLPPPPPRAATPSTAAAAASGARIGGDDAAVGVKSGAEDDMLNEFEFGRRDLTRKDITAGMLRRFEKTSASVGQGQWDIAPGLLKI